MTLIDKQNFDFEAWDDLVHTSAQQGRQQLKSLLCDVKSFDLPDYLKVFCEASIRIEQGEIGVAELALEAETHPLCRGLWMRTLELSRRKQSLERAILLPDSPVNTIIQNNDPLEHDAIRTGWLLWSIGKAGLHEIKNDLERAKALYSQGTLLAQDLKRPGLQLYCQMKMARICRGEFDRLDEQSLVKAEKFANKSMLDQFYQNKCADFLGKTRYPEARETARRISNESERQIWLTLINLLEEKPFDPEILTQYEKYKNNQSYIVCLVVINIRQAVMQFMKMDIKKANEYAENVLRVSSDVVFAWEYHEMVVTVCRIHANILLSEYQAALNLCMRYHQKILSRPDFGSDINVLWWLGVCYIKAYFYGNELEENPNYGMERAIGENLAYYAALAVDAQAKYSAYLMVNAPNTVNVILGVMDRLESLGDIPQEIRKAVAFLRQSYLEANVLYINEQGAEINGAPALGYQGSRTGLSKVTQVLDERMRKVALGNDYVYVNRHREWVEKNHDNLPVVWGWRVEELLKRLDYEEIYKVMLGVYAKYF